MSVVGNCPKQDCKIGITKVFQSRNEVTENRAKVYKIQAIYTNWTPMLEEMVWWKTEQNSSESNICHPILLSKKNPISLSTLKWCQKMLLLGTGD